jgi:MoxR-like ATPase
VVVLGDRAAMDEQRPGDAPPAMGLLGRSDVMNELDGTLAAIATAGGQAVLVSGEAGIGKSALVRRFAERHGADA